MIVVQERDRKSAFLSEKHSGTCEKNSANLQVDAMQPLCRAAVRLARHTKPL
jgi:hypothetical protein